ncbi:MAG: TlpA family protein disulfide reductase [Alphaproteobacteria bacterium]|nr:TlpA family protein disulfide reductase [Alphaproteobacteria bacterium]
MKLAHVVSLVFAIAASFIAGLVVSPRVVLPADPWVDLSAMPEALREKHRDPAFLAQEVKIEDAFAKQLAATVGRWDAIGEKQLPAGAPKFPIATLYNPPPEMAWPAIVPQGDEGAFSAAKEGWVILNLWASWCAPCVTELPDLDAAAAPYAERGVTLLVVNVDATQQDTSETVAKTFADRGVAKLAQMIASGGGIDAMFGATGLSRRASQLPANAIFAPGGKPYAVFFGGPEKDEVIWNTPEMVTFLDAIIATEAE